MSEKSETEGIKNRFPALSKKDIEGEIAAQEAAKGKYSMDMAEVERALTEYLDITDPIIWKGKAIAWVRRPSMKQLKELVPKEMMKYANEPNIPESILKKYEKFFYKKMEELIVIPKYTAEEWEAKVNPWFVRLFWGHIGDIAKLMEGQVRGF